jgi:hypothetical protein
MSLTGHHIDRKPTDGVPEAMYPLFELLQFGDEGSKPDLEWAASWKYHNE